MLEKIFNWQKKMGDLLSLANKEKEKGKRNVYAGLNQQAFRKDQTPAL